MSLRGRINFWAFASEHAADAAHDASHGEYSFVIGKKYFSDAVAAIIPALEEREVLHGFECGPCFRWRARIENRLYSRFHGMRFCVLGGLDREDRRP